MSSENYRSGWNRVAQWLHWLVAALIVPDAEVRIENVGLNPSRRAVIDALIEMGGEIEVRGAVEGDGGIEPVATVVARSSALRAIDIAGDDGRF